MNQMLKLDLSKIAPNSDQMTDEMLDNTGAITGCFRRAQHSDEHRVILAAQQQSEPSLENTNSLPESPDFHHSYSYLQQQTQS